MCRIVRGDGTIRCVSTVRFYIVLNARTRVNVCKARSETVDGPRGVRDGVDSGPSESMTNVDPVVSKT